MKKRAQTTAKVITRAAVRKTLWDILFDIAGGAIYAAGVYCFAVAADFAPGGIAGLSIIINHYLPFIPIGACSLLLNIPVVIFSYRTLGKKFFIQSVKTMVISALILDCVFPNLPVYTGNPLLAAIFAGALSGVGLAIIYMRGSSTGGTDFIIMSVKRKMPHMSIGQLSLAIDGCVLFLGGVVFGRIDAVLEGFIMTYVSTSVVDKIMYGFSSGKSLSIITEKGDDIAKVIGANVGRGVTMMDVVGTYSGQKKQLLLCVCGKSEAFAIRRAAYSIDPSALIMISPVDEVYGLGFKDPAEV